MSSPSDDRHVVFVTVLDRVANGDLVTTNAALAAAQQELASCTPAEASASSLYSAALRAAAAVLRDADAPPPLRTAALCVVSDAFAPRFFVDGPPPCTPLDLELVVGALVEGLGGGVDSAGGGGGGHAQPTSAGTASDGGGQEEQLRLHALLLLTPVAAAQGTSTDLRAIVAAVARVLDARAGAGGSSAAAPALHACVWVLAEVASWQSAGASGGRGSRVMLTAHERAVARGRCSWAVALLRCALAPGPAGDAVRDALTCVPHRH